MELKINGKNWEESLKDDTVLYWNLRLYGYTFHRNENGIPFRKGKITKSFKEYLKKDKINEVVPFMRKELERRGL